MLGDGREDAHTGSLLSGSSCSFERSAGPRKAPAEQGLPCGPAGPAGRAPWAQLRAVARLRGARRANQGTMRGFAQTTDGAGSTGGFERLNG